MIRRYLILFLFLVPTLLLAQHTQLTVQDKASKRLLQGASISENKIVLGVTDSLGQVHLSLTQGIHLLKCSLIGYEAKLDSINFPCTTPIIIELNMSPTLMEEITVVSTTRNNQRIENSPLKVEVIGREEMDEENSIKPASIASILGDLSGVQIQQSSVVSGNANIRIQGLEGRYTQILRDGLPLYEGFSGGFGILSIPPIDLKQVELIKGAASTLYGGGAIAGLVNIISRKPTEKQQTTFTINRSSLKESNINSFISKKYKHIGYTFYAGYTAQKEIDVNKDGISDVPKLGSFVVHPRLFFYPNRKTNITLGYSGTIERRKGGDMLVLAGKPDQIHQYVESNNNTRHTGELFIEHTLHGKTKLEFKSSFSSFDRTIQSNTIVINGNQVNRFSELSLFAPYEKGSLVVGVNSVGDAFNKISSSTSIPLNSFSNQTIGVFIQNTLNIGEKTILEAGIREDFHNHYGNFFLPRISMFHRFNEHWASRSGIGYGYKAPNVISPQIQDLPLEKILPLSNNIKAEQSVGFNIELNYKKEWNDGNSFFINHAFFVTQVSNPIIHSIYSTDVVDQYILFSNAAKPILTRGFDTYIQTTLNQWEIYLGYTFTIAERKYLPTNQFMPLTPKNRMAFTLLRAFEETGWRVGIEASYNGKQIRFDESKTPGYLFTAAMIEKKLNEKVKFVLNGENLFDYRQSRIEPIFTGSITNPSFKELWAPIDGRVINLAMFIKL
jgi:iron complex outermembrane receptor protein/outer membrane receptor for ferrienterochelin and colicins